MGGLVVSALVQGASCNGRVVALPARSHCLVSESRLPQAPPSQQRPCAPRLRPAGEGFSAPAAAAGTRALLSRLTAQPPPPAAPEDPPAALEDPPAALEDSEAVVPEDEDVVDLLANHARASEAQGEEAVEDPMAWQDPMASDVVLRMMRELEQLEQVRWCREHCF